MAVGPHEYAHLESREQWDAWLSRRLRAEADVLGGPLSQDVLLSAGNTYARAASAVGEEFIDGHLQSNAERDAHPDVELAGKWSTWAGAGGPYTYIWEDGRKGKTVDELPEDVDPQSVIHRQADDPYVSISDRLDVLAALIEALPNGGDEPQRAEATAHACRNALQAIDHSEQASRWAAFQRGIAALVSATTASPAEVEQALQQAVGYASEGYASFVTHGETLAQISIVARLYSALDPVEGAAHLKTASLPHDTATIAATHAYWDALELGGEPVVEAIAAEFVDQAAELAQQALVADDLDSFQRLLHEAAPSALASVTIYKTINTHRQKTGLEDDRLQRAENAAEEWKVRIDGAFNIAVDLLDRPTYSIVQDALRRERREKGGRAARELARELSVVYLFFPKFMIPQMLGEGAK